LDINQKWVQKDGKKSSVCRVWEGFLRKKELVHRFQESEKVPTRWKYKTAVHGFQNASGTKATGRSGKSGGP
jgi:hypothetical protein